jgi:hypothetical protein
MTKQTTTTSDPQARWEPWEDGALPTDIGRRAVLAGCLDPQAEAAVDSHVGHLAGLLDHHDPIAAVTRFLAEPQGHDERLERRAVLRLAERLTLPPGCPPLDWPGWEDPDPNQRRRVLNPIEIAVVRLYSTRTSQRGSIIGLLDTGGSSGELVALTQDAFTTNDGVPSAVQLPGTGRATNIGPEARVRRLRPLPAWSRPHLAKRLALPDQSNVLYDGQAHDAARVQSAILMNVRKVLQDAGLAGDPTVQPASIANTAGRALYDVTGNLEDVAVAMGVDNLDRLRREIGIRPHRAHR